MSPIRYQQPRQEMKCFSLGIAIDISNRHSFEKLKRCFCLGSRDLVLILYTYLTIASFPDFHIQMEHWVLSYHSLTS